MTVELLQTLSVVAYVVAGVLFLVAVALFFLLDIPKLYGEVFGHTARKAIEAIRQQNAGAEGGIRRSNPVSAERRTLTGKISHSGRVKIQTANLPVGATPANETTVLSSTSNETTVLSTNANETTVLSHAANETTVLSNAVDETTSLSNSSPGSVAETLLLSPDQPIIDVVSQSDSFKLEVEMAFTGSSEMIE